MNAHGIEATSTAVAPPGPFTGYRVAPSNGRFEHLFLADLQRHDNTTVSSLWPDKLTDERTAKWQPVLLLGNPETVEACADLAPPRLAGGAVRPRDTRRCWRMGSHAGRGIVARARFYAAARHDIGVASGEIPPGDPWEAPLSAKPEPPAAPMTAGRSAKSAAATDQSQIACRNAPAVRPVA